MAQHMSQSLVAMTKHESQFVNGLPSDIVVRSQTTHDQLIQVGQPWIARLELGKSDH